MKKLLCCIAIVFILYGIGVKTSDSFNMYEWSLNLRALIVFTSIVAFAIFVADIFLEDLES